MRDSKGPVQWPAIGRGDFLKIGAGGAGAMMTMGATMTALQADATAQAHGKVEPFWAAHPGKAGVGRPVSIDLDAHWSPESYNKALAELGHPVDSFLTQRVRK
jgi:hypothetical protein